MVQTWVGMLININKGSKAPLKSLKKNSRERSLDFCKQDKDSCHTAKSTHKWLDESVGKWFETPAKSPDLNPIEMIWNTLESRVMAHDPKTVAELEKWVQYEWKSIDQGLINRTIDHMIKTIPKIIEKDGEYVE